MTWIQKRTSSRSSGSRNGASPAPEGTPPPALPPLILQMLADVPTKAYFRPDEVADYFNVSVDLIQQFLTEGKLLSIQVSPRIRRIPRASVCDYIRLYVQAS